MSRFIHGLSLASRIWLLIAIPLLAMVGASGHIMFANHRTIAVVDDMVELAELSTRISALVHELQKERGNSAVFIGSRGQQLAAELPQQRALTDSMREALEQRLATIELARHGGNLVELVAAARSAVGELPAKRQAIAALAIAAPDSNAYFTSTIARLLAVVVESSKLSRNGEVAGQISAFVTFMQAKERAGQERATGAPNFASGRFTPALYLRFVQVVSEQQAMFLLFEGYATAAQREFLRATAAGPDVQNVLRMRAAALAAGPEGALTGMSGTEWFNATTARINLMKTVEDRIAGDMLAVTAAQRAEAALTFWINAALVLCVLAASIAVSMVTARSIRRPIASMTGAMQDLARGDTQVEVPGRGRGDEIGRMADAVEVFRANMVETERLRAEQERERAERAAQDEAARAEQAARSEAERQALAARAAVASAFAAEVNKITQALSAQANELQTAASGMSATAAETNRQSGEVASASEQASANVQTVASAAEELSASIAEIGRQVVQSNSCARRAVSDAEQTNVSVRTLAEAAEKIGDVVKLIADIAGQTNLLALNATIEAARAGEAGRGFAVVAAEVKTLASRTASATEEIGAKIAEIQNATGANVAAIAGIGKVIGEIEQIATAIAGAIEEQNVTTQEIARNVHQAASGTRQVSSAITVVNQAAGDTGAAAAQVLNTAGELARQSDALRGEVDRFLAQLKAA
jgi:methyl-accepting chemotaxis protein